MSPLHDRVGSLGKVAERGPFVVQTPQTHQTPYRQTRTLFTSSASRCSTSSESQVTCQFRSSTSLVRCHVQRRRVALFPSHLPFVMRLFHSQWPGSWNSDGRERDWLFCCVSSQCSQCTQHIAAWACHSNNAPLHRSWNVIVCCFAGPHFHRSGLDVVSHKPGSHLGPWASSRCQMAKWSSRQH